MVLVVVEVEQEGMLVQLVKTEVEVVEVVEVVELRFRQLLQLGVLILII